MTLGTKDAGITSVSTLTGASATAKTAAKRHAATEKSTSISRTVRTLALRLGIALKAIQGPQHAQKLVRNDGQD